MLQNEKNEENKECNSNTGLQEGDCIEAARKLKKTFDRGYSTLAMPSVDRKCRIYKNGTSYESTTNIAEYGEYREVCRLPGITTCCKYKHSQSLFICSSEGSCLELETIYKKCHRYFTCKKSIQAKKKN